MREWWSKIRRAQRRRGLHNELADEIRSHLEFLAEENASEGMTPEEAANVARRKFGNATLIKEKTQEAWRFPRFESFLQDLHYGLRAIFKSPGFSLVLILTLALGIGANTAIFSVVYAVLLRSLPYPSGERLVHLGESGEGATDISVTWINFEHWRTDNHTFEDMAGFENADLTLTGRGEAQLVHAGVVTSEFFKLTGSRPVLGRLFDRADDRAGATPAVLLAYEFWARTLGGDPAIVGQTLDLNGGAYQVIGVLRPGLKFFSSKTALYLPLEPRIGSATSRSQHGSMRAIGLLKPRVTLTQARTDLNAIMQRLAKADPGPENDYRVYAEFLSAATTESVRQVLLVLLGAVGMVLIIACSNVSSLLLARSTSRVQELAIRAAIGAGRGRLARQLLTETLLVAGIGGTAGVGLAALCIRFFVLAGPSDIPRLSEVRLDLPVLLFACGVTVFVGLLAGVAPVRSAGQIDLAGALREGSAGAGSARRWQVLRNGLAVGEIAITLVLAFASGLLLRSLRIAQNSYPGFDADHLLALELQLPPESYKSEGSIRNFYDRLERDLRGQPGVQSVGAVTCPPSAGDCGDWWYSIVGKPMPRRSDVPLSLFNTADSTYFRTMHMALRAGRGFTEADTEHGRPVIVINEELTHKWWASPQHAIGEQIKVGGPYMKGPAYGIVGVVANVSQMGLDTAPLPEIYYPFSQRTSSAMVVMIRTAANPEALMATVRREVASLDRNIPIQSLRNLEQWLGAPLERRKFSTWLLGIFALLAMALAAVGIYGVLNYWVGVRQKEIAVRMALGAQPAAILRWAGFHGARLAGCGLALGALGSWGASRWLKSLVFGVSVQDSGMLLAATGVVFATATLAACLPLWRALRVDILRNLHDA